MVVVTVGGKKGGNFFPHSKFTQILEVKAIKLKVYFSNSKLEIFRFWDSKLVSGKFHFGGGSFFVVKLVIPERCLERGKLVSSLTLFFSLANSRFS